MQISKDEAAASLAAANRANLAARAALRAHHGHFHLWLWGVVWMIMAFFAYTRGSAGAQLFPWISVGGMIGSVIIGILQKSRVRQPVDRRFLGALAALIGFAMVAPFVLRLPHFTPETCFAYIALVVAQSYILSGIWFDSYMTWLGVLLAILILVGVFLVPPAFFWIWVAVCCGGTLVGTGFYVRFFWR